MIKQSPATETAIIEDLQARGLLYQSTPGLAEHLKAPRTIYCGFDPTADSLHIGSLVPLLTLRRLQQAGHRAVILVGGATGMIGDPSFKATERKLLDEATLAHNVAGITAQVTQLFASAPHGQLGPAVVVNNYSWTKDVSVLEFLRDIGKHFSVNQMIARDSVKERLNRDEAGISFTEFAYALLQGFDFHEMYRDETLKCTVQLGASDQWGNMVAGTELIRKKLRGEAHVLTLPLLTKADGTKFGKSESGTIWLDAAKTSPYAFYQFWLNTSDADIEKYLKLFSFRSLTEVEALMAQHFENTSARIPQKALAEELSLMLHGEESLQAAKRISEVLFGGDINELTKTDFSQLEMDGLPTFKISQGRYFKDQITAEAHNNLAQESGDITFLDKGKMSIIDALVVNNEGQYALATSKREAREFLAQGAIQHNGVVVKDEALELTTANAKYGKYHLLKRGKKQFALLVMG